MLHKHLEKHFNFSTFRPGQEEIIQAILAGQDVVALMPTGGGKSICFQLPALIKNSLTVVVSPLIALMKDQVDSLQARGIEAGFINSSLNEKEMQLVIEKVKSGQIKLLYVAPERLMNQQFNNLFTNIGISFLAVDEAHCVSQWGHDFRPDYLQIKNFIAKLKIRPTVGAFTATATPEVKADIIKNLDLKNPQVFIRGFDRPNLKFFVQTDLKKQQRQTEVLRIIQTLPGSGIVYSISRQETEDIANFLSDNGIKAVAYHAGLASNRRTQIQNDFMEDNFKVICATIAFGMGVDKADIRFVIHAGMPATLEGYYQEAGRAGRDGEQAYCILLQAKRDYGLHNYFILKSRDEMASQGKNRDEINRICNIKYDRLEKMNDYVYSTVCRRKNILQYFADPDLSLLKSNCEGCDICLNFKWTNATPLRHRTRAERPEVKARPNTVLETAKLYQQKYTPEQIAKARSISMQTVITHLADWYASGGELNIRDFVSGAEEKQILSAIKEIGSVEYLKPIKEILPESIGYEKIRMVVGGLKRTNV
ncbi:MAG: RecQ family ATP-dependent DNA helicase [Candidatus Magasanikiibacteriota bacterium]